MSFAVHREGHKTSGRRCPVRVKVAKSRRRLREILRSPELPCELGEPTASDSCSPPSPSSLLPSARWRWISPTRNPCRPASSASSPGKAGSTCWSTASATAPTAPSRTCRWPRPGTSSRSTSSAGPAHPAGPPRYAGPAGRHDHQHHLDGRQDLHPRSAAGTTPPSSPSKPSATACAWRSHRSASGQPRTMKWLSAQDSTIAPDAPQ